MDAVLIDKRYRFTPLGGRSVQATIDVTCENDEEIYAVIDYLQNSSLVEEKPAVDKEKRTTLKIKQEIEQDAIEDNLNSIADLDSIGNLEL